MPWQRSNCLWECALLECRSFSCNNIAFDDNYAFYLGDGGVRDFHRHSRVTGFWRKLCKDLEGCPTLQDLVDYYLEGRTIEKTRKGMEDELNFVAEVLNKDGISEEKKAETLLVPEIHEECPVKRTHLWRLNLNPKIRNYHPIHD